MDHSHPGNSDLMSTLSSIIQASVAAGFQQYIGKSLDVRIEREVDAALKKRLASPYRHFNAQSYVTVPSIPGIEPIGQASSICQPTISTAPSNHHSQNVLEASPADSVRPTAPERERQAPVIKPARWNIIDLTDVFDELPEESLNVTSSIEHSVADMSVRLIADEKGNDTDIIIGEMAPDPEAAASKIRADSIQETWTSTQKRSLEEIVQRAPIADIDVDPPKRRTFSDLDKAAREGNNGYDSRETVLVTQPIKRAKRKPNPPGYTTGPPIRFTKVCSPLTASPNQRGWPRIVDLQDFMDESNKQNLTIADIVATVLWKHGPKTLEAFLDFEGHPGFRFDRREIFDRTKECWISRYLDEEGVVMVAVCSFILFVKAGVLTR